MLILFTILGILIGSFLNVLIIRVPAGEDFVKTRSHCCTCNYTLRWYDLIPLISYMTLGGRCRKCGEKISIVYPIIELINGLFYGLIYYLKGFSMTLSGVESILIMIMFSTLLVISMIDLRHLIIPDGFVIFIFILGLVRLGAIYAFTGTAGIKGHIIAIFIVSVPLLLIAIISKGGMGMGDVKLMAAAGFFLGARDILIAFVLGAIVGGVIAIGLVAFKGAKRVMKIPFGPFLAIGIFSAMIFGEEIIAWYLNII